MEPKSANRRLQLRDPSWPPGGTQLEDPSWAPGGPAPGAGRHQEGSTEGRGKRGSQQRHRTREAALGTRGAGTRSRHQGGTREAAPRGKGSEAANRGTRKAPGRQHRGGREARQPTEAADGRGSFWLIPNVRLEPLMLAAYLGN